MEASPTSFNHVVAMPYPGRGHINPMMNLCKLLVSNNNSILVTFVVTEEWLTFLSSEPKPDNNINFRSISNVVPSELIRSRDHPAFLEAVMTKMEEPFEELLNLLDHPPSVILYDNMLYWVVVVGNRRNIPVASFWTMSASVFSIFLHQHLLELNGHYPVKFSENGDERVNYIPGVSSTCLADLPLFDDSNRSKRIMQVVLRGLQGIHKAQYLLISSIYELESQAIDILKSKFSIPIYTFGPTIPCISLKNDLKPNTNNIYSYIEWLDSQPIGSVLYIAQGSFLSASSEQIDEIANALCESNIRFLWIARNEASRLKQMCGNMGLVLEWCDQLRVLSHSSIGGFWSHCGWNSTKESVIFGVPLLTFPISLDQPFNSKMIVEDWKVGLRVKDNVNGDVLVKKSEIVKLVCEFMDLDSDLTKGIRERSGKFKKICCDAIGDGGSADIDLKAFIGNIIMHSSKSTHA
ncbi:UDP-glycosyltransferase 87A1-like [Vicia villosa]|uniref:UDP-glycosyltransferase 87A1-like n=1 Tax=Vicia villosa TaxID=3911 RepID=UPI00273AEF8F|nr:UDP-glycosyltransferase 87A1-like [Vicia villosa]XP_058747936.1 UDP-glycosyltransferase 87A1-like [Vicia villosa]